MIDKFRYKGKVLWIVCLANSSNSSYNLLNFFIILLTWIQMKYSFHFTNFVHFYILHNCSQWCFSAIYRLRTPSSDCPTFWVQFYVKGVRKKVDSIDKTQYISANIGYLKAYHTSNQWKFYEEFAELWRLQIATLLEVDNTG